MVWRALDEFDLDLVLAVTPGTALLMFGQPACGACRGWYQQLPLWLADSAIQLFYIDVARASGLAARFDVFHLPGFMLYRDGLFHCRLAAPFSAAAVQQAIAYGLAAAPEEEP